MNIKWLFLIFLFGCAGVRPVARQPIEKKQEEKKDSVKNTATQNTDNPLKKKDRNTFNISLLLPFHIDELPYDSLDNNLKEVPAKSTLAIHYYEGVLMALDSLDKAGLKLKLKVYDSDADSNDIKKIFKKPELKESDAIIGPIMNSGLMVVSRFAKENKKYLFSPLSASTAIKDNPYFVMANASLNTHCEAITNYIAAKYKPKKVFILYHESGTEETYANYFKNTFDKTAAPFQWIRLTEEKDSNFFKIENYLSATDENIIIIPSFDEAFVNVITKHLYSLRDNYKLSVFGMPTWPEMESLRIDYLEGINTHITNSFWVNDSSAYYHSFKKKYYDHFKSLPTDYTIQGYDLVFFIGSLMLKYEDKWPNQLGKANADELGDEFQLKPHFSKDDKTENEIQYMENRSVHILKYSNNTLTRVN